MAIKNGDLSIVSEPGGYYRLMGTLGFATARKALKQTTRSFKRGASIVLDLEGVERADSAGVAFLIECLRLARRVGAEIRFTRLPPQLRALVEVTGVGELLPPVDPV